MNSSFNPNFLFRTLTVLVLLVVFIGPATAVAADVEKLDGVIKQGRAKAQGCTRCHGRDGMRNLAKQANWEHSISTFVIQQLLLFRGERVTHEIMNAVAKPLSNVDIYEIALWYEWVSN